MTERELGKALLNLDMAAAAAPDPRQLTRTILERDRRRVRWLTLVAVACWGITLFAIALFVLLFFLYLDPRLHSYAAGRHDPAADARAWVAIAQVTAWVVLGCAATALVAAVCTVLLVLVSRRATLRQINANLVEISEQLKHLRPLPGPPPNPSGTA
jgi:hypothetical protein